MSMVTVEHLRRLAMVNPRSLFADCVALVETEDGITSVPWHVVVSALEGTSKLRSCRLLYHRSTFIEEGVLVGRKPRTIDGSDLDARLAVIAAGINETEDEDA